MELKVSEQNLKSDMVIFFLRTIVRNSLKNIFRHFISFRLFNDIL